MVSFARWFVHELAVGGSALGVEVVGDDGLDIDPDAADCAWWCPGRHAGRLAASGIDHRFATPGPGFLARLDPALVGREVWCGPLADLPAWAGDRFAKPADVKIPALPAGVFAGDARFRRAAASAGLGLASQVIVSQVVELVAEWRFWVLAGVPVAASPYLECGVTWDGLEDRTVPQDAWAFAVRAAAGATGVPRGWVVDVAADRGGRLMVVEANPAWSSGCYWAAARFPAQVVATILASQGPGSGGSRWADDRPARRLRPLTVRPGPAART